MNQTSTSDDNPIETSASSASPAALCLGDFSGDNLYRLMFLNAPVGMALVSREGRFMEVNPRLCQMLGYTYAELLELSFQQITFPEDLATSLEQLRQLNAGEVRRISLDKRYQRRDGSGFWVTVTSSAILDESNQPICYIATYEDISEKKTYEELLELREKKYRTVRRRAHEAEIALVNLSEFMLRQIGQELHDDVGQVLTGAAMLADSIARKIESKRPKEAATARQLTQLLNEAVDKTRLISHGLAPLELDEGGLLPMLHSLARRIQSTQGVAVSVSEDCPSLSLVKEAALHIFRIIQEATSNVVRHSGATTLWITLEDRNHTLTISVLDNGIGITEDMSHGIYKGIGISNMHARADLIGAQLDIKKREPGGTAVVLSLPLSIGKT